MRDKFGAEAPPTETRPPAPPKPEEPVAADIKSCCYLAKSCQVAGCQVVTKRPGKPKN